MSILHKNNQIILFIVGLIALALVVIAVGEAFTGDPPVGLPNEKIVRAITQGQPYRIKGPRAVFEKDGVAWTIVSANAPKVNIYGRPIEWPVKGNTFEVLVIPKPITNYKILPWTNPIINTSPNGNIFIQGNPGEYEPASFVIRSGDQSLENVTLTITDLIHQNSRISTISKRQIDLRVVKCWYQAGTELHIPKGKRKTLTPELLLKDDSIVQVDHYHQVNLIKNFDKIQDTKDLKPFSIPNRENKQIWLTLHIPGTAESGTYRGKIRITADNSISEELTVEVEVLPFKLDEPIINYSMFYDAELLQKNEQYHIARPKRTEAQMLAELQDMHRHGVYNPVVTMKSWNPDSLAKVLELRKQAGISNDVIYYVSWPGLKDDPVYMQRVIDHCGNAVNFLTSQGVKQVYFYGFDELKGDELRDAASFYKAFQAQGAGIFVAGANDFFATLGASIDIPIVWGQGGNIDRPRLKSLIDQAHTAGKKIWIYSFPQSGKEEPDTYRRNFGLTLWKLGLDGACNYAYQAAMNHPWDDFDHPTFRDEVMTYPTLNGVIPTLQWEGWREGVKDVRYLSTLLRLRDDSRDAALKAELDREIAAINVNGDLDQARNRMIDLIIQCLH